MISSQQNCWWKALLIFTHKGNKIKINNTRLYTVVDTVLTNGKFIHFLVAGKMATELTHTVYHICQLISVIKYSISGAIRQQSLTRFIRCTTWTCITHSWMGRMRLQRKLNGVKLLHKSWSMEKGKDLPMHCRSKIGLGFDDLKPRKSKGERYRATRIWDLEDDEHSLSDAVIISGFGSGERGKKGGPEGSCFWKINISGLGAGWNKMSRIWRRAYAIAKSHLKSGQVLKLGYPV